MSSTDRPTPEFWHDIEAWKIYASALEAKVRAFADARDKALADAIEAAKAANHFQEVAQRLKHQLIVDYAEDDDE